MYFVPTHRYPVLDRKSETWFDRTRTTTQKEASREERRSVMVGGRSSIFDDETGLTFFNFEIVGA
jgi:hypothetical protein